MYDAILITPMMCGHESYPIGTKVTVGNVHNDNRRVVFAPGVEAIVADEHVILVHSAIAHHVERLCVACGDNEVDTHDALCERCVQLTMEALSIERAINKLCDADERIAGVIEYDNAEEQRSPVPYVTIRDAAWDWVSGTSDEELTRIVTKWVPSIVNAMVGGTR